MYLHDILISFFFELKRFFPKDEKLPFVILNITIIFTKAFRKQICAFSHFVMQNLNSETQAPARGTLNLGYELSVLIIVINANLSPKRKYSQFIIQLVSARK